MLPSSFTWRNSCARVQLENFAVMPNTATTIIHSTAPGPPVMMATATPAMLPRPTVADSALVRARKWLISPSSSGLSKCPRTTSMACLNARRLMKRYQTVKKIEPIANTATKKGILAVFFFCWPVALSITGLPARSTSSTWNAP
jgi:hypothetical protein